MSFAIDNLSRTNSNIDDPLMPPPKKVFRLGTKECEDALDKGTIQLSLPEYQCENMHTNDDKDEVICVEAKATNEDSRKSQCECFSTTESREVRKTDSDSMARYTDYLQDSFVVHGGGSQHSEECEVAMGPRDRRTPARDNHSLVSGSANDVPRFQQPDPTLPRFCDIIGHGAVKLRIEEILLPLALPLEMARSILTGVRSMPTSILFYGPPGVGKTKLATAIAGEAEAAFLSVGPGDILSKYVGESEAAVRGLFKRAHEQAQQMESRTAVLFLDEIDALGLCRGAVAGGEQSTQGGDSCSRRVLAELLIQLSRHSNLKVNLTPGFLHDGTSEGDSGNGTEVLPKSERKLNIENDLDGQARVIVVAATNRPSDCDPALLRRFGVRAHVGLPTMYDRRRILQRLLKGIANTISRVELKDLAKALEGWSGSELESLTREACMAPVRECIRAAARKRRRLRGTEQQCGDYSGQHDGETAGTNNDRQTAQDLLHQKFDTMRAVTLNDFEAAIEFWGGSQDNGNSSNFLHEGGDSKNVHYDSSSSSEEDD